MKPALRRLSILAAIFSLAPLAKADAPAPISAAEQSAFLKPYITQDAFVVAHIDTAQIDTAAMEKYIVDTLSTVGLDDPNIPQQIGQARMIADAFLARFRKVGGRQAYMIVNQHAEGSPTPPIMLFPLESGGDAKALVALLSTIPDTQAAQVSDTLVALGAVPQTMAAASEPADQAASDLVAKIKALVPADRPEFDKALAAGSGALQLIISPAQSSRDALSKDSPTLPPPFGGGSSDIIAKNFQYALISLTPPPNPELHITFQSDSPDNAKASLDLINNYFKFMTSMAHTQDFAPVFAPQVNGSAVEMNLDAKKIQTLTASIVPEMFAGRRRAQVVASAANMRQDLLGAVMYANDNNGDWPTDLQTLVDKGYAPNAKILSNPTDPKHRPYEYHPFTKDQMNKLDASFTPVLWEATDDDKTPLNVGYLDGHVEKLSSKAELQKQLDACQEKLKAP